MNTVEIMEQARREAFNAGHGAGRVYEPLKVKEEGSYSDHTTNKQIVRLSGENKEKETSK